VDRLIFFIAPRLLGGRTAPGPLGGDGIPRMGDAIPVRDLTVRRYGADLALFAYVHRPD
jgi:diaminohydroxyphosphoribosylaminopyrimidine deaminase / 5-amino-6-(5-phosphoribosylamino)uracil reductase